MMILWLFDSMSLV